MAIADCILLFSPVAENANKQNDIGLLSPSIHHDGVMMRAKHA